MISKEVIAKANEIIAEVFSALDGVLVGQEKVKNVVAASLLCSSDSKILLVGNTGVGKTTLAKYLANQFVSEKISITSDMIPNDIIQQLKDKRDMQFLHIDEFNRASGKVQSVFIELFSEKQIHVAGETYPFSDFYVFATQNSADIAGIFNVPQAVYDRFDVSVSFEELTEEEKKLLLFGDFEPDMQSSIDFFRARITEQIVKRFPVRPVDQNMMMQVFSYIDAMTIYNEKLFAGSNIRAHKFILKLAKIAALSNGRSCLLPQDVVYFVKPVYMHRIDQNKVTIGSKEVLEKFDEVEDKILSLRRRRKS